MTVQGRLVNDLRWDPGTDFLIEALPDVRTPALQRQARQLIDQARGEGLVDPRAFYGEFAVQRTGDSTVRLGQVTFDSGLLAGQLDGLSRAYGYVITLGEEFMTWMTGREDLLERYFADELANVILGKAQEAFFDHLARTHGLDGVGSLNPGSLPQWPLEAQRELFTLLDAGVVKRVLGVELNDSLLMQPVKSLSGVAYASAERFCCCRLCERRDCSGRREPFGGKADS